MRRAYSYFLITALLATISTAAEPDDEDFVPLFNGKDLTGWVLTNTPPATWTFQDGMLIDMNRDILLKVPPTLLASVARVLKFMLCTAGHIVHIVFTKVVHLEA